MTCLDWFLRRAAWIFLILIAGAHVLIPTHVLAQIDTCTLNTVDGTNDVEETVCLASDNGNLDAWTSADSWAYSDYQNWPNGDPYVVGLGTEVQVSDDINGFDFDSGLVEDGAASGSVSPTSGATYTASGTTYECYDPTGTGSSDCNWQGAGGVSVSATMPGSPPLPTPTLSLTTSGTPSAFGQPVTFTATISFDATGEDVDFYNDIGYIGSGTFSGTSGTFSTSALPTGTYSIYASYNGDSNYSAASSNSIAQVVANPPTPITYAPPPSGTIDYSYTITPAGGPSGYAPNGNLLSYTDSVNGAWYFQATGYDSLNRLVSGIAESGYYYGLLINWSYDSFGNRMSETFGGSPSISLSTSTTNYYNTNNQVSISSLMSGGPLGYDSAGNVTTDNANNYLYDGEGRVCAVQNRTFGGMTEYIYDAEGTRVAKGTIYAWTCDTTQNSFTLTNTYVIGPSGEQLTETDGSGNWLHTNVFGAGKLLATYSYIDSSQTTTDTYFALSDWLGNKRAVVSAGGCGTGYVSLPYGGDLTATSLPGFTQCPDATEHHFTGKERDTESGNDYMLARYYNSATGRFLSPDWSAKEEPVPYAKLDNPQSLNLYSYVGNNPMGKADPDGHDGISDTLKLAGGAELVAPEATPVIVVATAVVVVGVVVHDNWNSISSWFHKSDTPAPVAPAPAPGATPAAPAAPVGATPLPANPDDLTQQGYHDVSHPDASAAGHRTFVDPATGDKVRHDQGTPGANGHEGEDHYHRYNPNSTGKSDQYLDANGKPVPGGSEPSHLKPQPPPPPSEPNLQK